MCPESPSLILNVFLMCRAWIHELPSCSLLRLHACVFHVHPLTSVGSGAGDGVGNERRGPLAPLLPSSFLSFTQSFTFASNIGLSLIPSLSLSLSLSPPKLAQLSISPPAVPPAVSPPRARSPTTIQVTGQEKEHAAFTMGQWRPIKQSFPFSPALFHHCRDWKRQTFGEVVRGAGGLQGCRATFPSTYNCLKDHSDKHSNTLLLTRFSRCHHGSLSNSRAIMLFNTIVKVKTEACGVISNVRNPVNSRRLKIRAHWIFGSMMK